LKEKNGASGAQWANKTGAQPVKAARRIMVNFLRCES